MNVEDAIFNINIVVYSTIFKCSLPRTLMEFFLISILKNIDRILYNINMILNKTLVLYYKDFSFILYCTFFLTLFIH